MRNQRCNNTTLLLMVPNCIFLIYWIVLLVFNRFSQDDYGFLAHIRSTDPISFVSGVYNNYSGRFVRYFIYWIKYRVLNQLLFPWLYPAFIYIISILSVIVIGRKLNNGNNIIYLGILCYNLLIFCNLEFCAFFWTAAVDYYATAFLYPLWLFYFCFICKNKIWGIIGILVCSLLIGGGCEAHSPLFLYVIFCYFIYCVIFKKQIATDTRNKLLISFLLIFICFGFVIFAPGSAGRVAMYTDTPSVIGMLIQSFKSFAILTYLLSFRLPFLCILFFLSYWTGFCSESYRIIDNRTLLYCVICFVGMVWISTFPAAYGMNSLGFHRIYTPEVAALIALCSIFGYKYGLSKRYCTTKCSSRLAIISSAIISICIIIHIVLDFPSAKAYAEADADRIERCLLAKKAGSTEDLYFDSLPVPVTYNLKSLALGMFGNEKKPVIYYSNGICSKYDKDNSLDPDVCFGNDCIISYYQLPFYIYNE